MTPPPAPDSGTPDLAAAVAALCNPERVRVERDPVAVKAAQAHARRAVAEAREAAKGAGQPFDPKRHREVLDALRALQAGTAQWSERPSLLAQLRDSSGSSREQAERPGGGIRVPIDPDALDLLDRIRGTVRDALDLLGLPARRVDDPAVDPLAADLRRLAVAHWASVDGGVPARARLAKRLDHVPTEHAPGAPGYVQRVRALLDPDPGAADRSARDAPCPQCGALYVLEQRDGEDERVPTLRLDFVTPDAAHPVRLLRGIACRSCGHYVWREGGWDEDTGEFVPLGEFAALREHVAGYAAALSEWAAGQRAAERAERESRYPEPRRTA